MAPGCCASHGQTSQTWSVPAPASACHLLQSPPPPACGGSPRCSSTASGDLAGDHRRLQRRIHQAHRSVAVPRRSGGAGRPAEPARLITTLEAGRSGSARQRAGSRQAGKVWGPEPGAGWRWLAGGCCCSPIRRSRPRWPPGAARSEPQQRSWSVWRLQQGRPQGAGRINDDSIPSSSGGGAGSVSQGLLRGQETLGQSSPPTTGHNNSQTWFWCPWEGGRPGLRPLQGLALTGTHLHDAKANGPGGSPPASGCRPWRNSARVLELGFGPGPPSRR